MYLSLLIIVTKTVRWFWHKTLSPIFNNINCNFSSAIECINHFEACDGNKICPSGDDEQPFLCENGAPSTLVCFGFWFADRRITSNTLLCALEESTRNGKPGIRLPPRFTLDNYSVTYQTPSFIFPKSVHALNMIKGSALATVNERSQSLTSFLCHRGIPVYLNKDIKCFCPPTLYGSKCQYQSRRVSITLQAGALEWQTPLVFIISLMDDIHEIVNSYHQIKYLSIRDCNVKFNFHLLYSTQPDLFRQTHSVRIHVFESFTTKYRASWSFPILFPFLPVYRLPIYLTVPLSSMSSPNHCS